MLNFLQAINIRVTGLDKRFKSMTGEQPNIQGKKAADRSGANPAHGSERLSQRRQEQQPRRKQDMGR